jgi:AcrR family transcriptional regulator
MSFDPFVAGSIEKIVLYFWASAFSGKVNMEDIVRTTYRHGNVPNALRAAARAILDDGGPETVGLREMARRVGVSPTAAYRHFASREDVLASVAAEGFRELATALEEAMKGPNPAHGLALAYVEFALQKRGLFRLMFGSILADRAKYPQLNKAATDAFRILKVAQSDGHSDGEDKPHEMAAWSLMHGLSSLFIDGLVPEQNIQSMMENILSNAIASPELVLTA